jgi:hypothetical protein
MAPPSLFICHAISYKSVPTIAVSYLTRTDEDGIRPEGRAGMRVLRIERYARCIEECHTLDELRALLRVIAAAGLSEQEFS